MNEWLDLLAVAAALGVAGFAVARRYLYRPRGNCASASSACGSCPESVGAPKTGAEALVTLGTSAKHRC